MRVVGACCFLVLAGAVSYAQTPAPATPNKPDKASAYYHYSLGHLYSGLAELYGNRGDYFTKAIENYRLAMQEDPSATFLAEELSDLYIQAGRYRDAVTQAEGVLKQNPGDLNARRLLARIYTRLIGDSQTNRIDESMMRKAIEQYQKIVEADPKDSDSWLMLGRLQKVAQNSVESEKAFKKVLELDPDNEDAITGLAMVYSDLGQNQQAADLLRRLADKNPSVHSLVALAQAYEQMRDYSLASETLRRALALSPPDPTSLKRAMAQDLLFADRLDDALKTYGELAAEDPTDAQAFLRMSQIYRQQHNWQKAHEASDKAKQLDPTNLEVRYNEVNLLEAEGRTSDAIVALNDTLASTAKKNYNAADRSNRILLLERLGQLYRSSEQYAPAVDAFRQMADLDPDMGPRVAAQIIDTYRQAKDYPKAEQEADAALKKYPNDRTVRLVRASMLTDLGKFDPAIADLKKLLDGKNDRETWLALAQTYDKAKRFDDMGKALDAAEKLSQSKEDKETVVFMRGAMYERMKKYDLSEAEFRKVLELNPDNAPAQNYLGFMFADRDIRLPEALDLITKALQREPNNAAYLDSLGWVYFRMGRFADAEDNLRRSLERSGNDPTVHDHLGDVYFKQGKLKDAITQWEASLKDWEGTPPADMEPAEVAKVQKKLEGAKVRLARESSALNKPN